MPNSRVDYYGLGWAKTHYDELDKDEKLDVLQRLSKVPYTHLYDFSALSIGQAVKGRLNGKHGRVTKIDERFYQVTNDDGTTNHYYPDQLFQIPDTNMLGKKETLDDFQASW
jgi:hypothetical protein